MTRFRFLSSGGEPQPGPVKKAKGKKERRGRAQAVREVIVVKDIDTAQFGDMERIQSRFRTQRQWTEIHTLSKSNAGQQIWIRARVHTVRKKGNKLGFMMLRQGFAMLQGIITATDDDGSAVSVPREMVKYAAKIPHESVVDVFGTLVATESPVMSATQQDVELSVTRMYVASASAPELPFQLDDASRPGSEFDASVGEKPDPQNGKDFVTVGTALRLDHRWIDLRTNAKHAIFRISSGVGHFFREFFYKKGFVEIHTPKIIPGASEGGASVFRLKYFGRMACLAQSPQLYKQMAVVSDLGKVFEIGPVFRAEDSNTHRHLCEFTGMDFEMQIYEHYDEVLEVLGTLFVSIFDNLNKHFAAELEAVNRQYPFTPLKYLKQTLILKFPEAVRMIHEVRDKMKAEGKSAKEIEEAGADCNPLKDFSTPNEKLLGRLIKEKFDTEFYIVDRYPLAARPFYTMPAPDDANYTNSYDAFLRGEEITSGAQRIHDPVLLEERATAHDIPLESIKHYVDCMRHGAMPHGGAGIGLERVVMLFLGLRNVRHASLFPRDPRRCAP
eukprot:335742_1